MSNSNSSSSSGGIGFIGLLTIAFIVLKLTGVITWSWWWVLSPLWIATGLTILFFGGVFGVALIVTLVKDRKAKKQRRNIRAA